MPNNFVGTMPEHGAVSTDVPPGTFLGSIPVDASTSAPTSNVIEQEEKTSLGDLNLVLTGLISLMYVMVGVLIVLHLKVASKVKSLRSITLLGL